MISASGCDQGELRAGFFWRVTGDGGGGTRLGKVDPGKRRQQGGVSRRY